MKLTAFNTTLGKTGLAAAVIFGLAAAASATPVSFKFDGVSNHVDVKTTLNGHYHNMYVGTMNLSLYETGNKSNAMNTVAFCAEISQSIRLGKDYDNYNVSSLQTANIGLSEAQARNVAILYDMYYMGQDASNWTTKQSTAFQVALWELTHDDDGSMVGNGLNTGNFRASGDQGSSYQENKVGTYVNEAGTYLSNVEAKAKNGYEPYTQVVALTSPTDQDLVVLGVAIPGGGGGTPVAVPFGVNPLPGLALIGFFGWRRLRKRLNAKREADQA